MLIRRRSQITGIVRERNLDITEEQLNRFFSGELIQKCFPNLSVGDREFILSGITEEEWDTTFSDSEEDEDNLDDDIAF
jgi:hypothetical protein